jgi:hypothetical protein
MAAWAAAGALVAFVCAFGVAVVVGTDALTTSPVAQSQFTAWFVIAGAVAVLLTAPIAGVAACGWARRATVRGPLEADVRWPVTAIQPAFAVLMFATGVAGGSAVVGAAIPHALMPALPEWLAVLWSAVAVLGALGLVTGAIYQPLDAVAMAGGLSLAGASAWLALGPLFDHLPRVVSTLALSISPVVAVSAASTVDIFHVEPIYQLSPLAHGQASYPPAAVVGVAYLTTAAALCMVAVWRLSGSGERSRTRKDMAA